MVSSNGAVSTPGTGARVGTAISTLGWVAAATAFGAAIRLPTLGHKSFWLDEIFSVTATSRGFGVLFRQLNADQLPLYHWLTYPLQFLGSGEGWLRLPAALAGILLIPALYLLGRSVGRPAAGLAAAAMASFSPYLVHYSQEHRPYSLFMLLSALGTWSLFVTLDARERSIRRQGLALLGVFTLANVLTHAFALFPVAFHWAAALTALARQARKRTLLAAVTAVAVLSLPVVFHLMPMAQLILSKRGTGNHSMLYLKVWPLLRHTFTQHAGSTTLLAWLFLGFVILGALFSRGRGRLLAFMGVCLFLGPLVVLRLVRPPYLYDPRYMSFALPLLMVVAGMGLSAVWVRFARLLPVLRRLGITGPALLAVLVFLPPSLVPLACDLRVGREDWHGAAAAVASRLQDGDRVLIWPFYLDNPFLYYLDRFSPPRGRTRLSPESSSSVYRMMVRSPREQAEPHDYRGSLLTVRGLRQRRELDDPEGLGMRTWLVLGGHDLDGELNDEFREIWVQEWGTPLGGLLRRPLTVLLKTPAGSP